MTVDQRNATAVITKTTQTSVIARRTPPRAGPTQMPRLSIVLELTLAAVSSSGVRARDGRSADCAGWNPVAITATKDASA